MTEAAFAGLAPYLEAEVARVDAALKRAFTVPTDPSTEPEESSRGIFGAPRLDDEIVVAMRHGALSGGKRLRPILCVAAYRACTHDPPHPVRSGDDVRSGGSGTLEEQAAFDADALYDLAVSLELVHAYSLMHDDLPCMDDAELRRGRPTTHREHGEETTMLAGVALIPAAALRALTACRALGCTPAASRRVAGHLMEAAGAGGMVGGQWLDLLGEGERLGPEALGALHARKTGALLAAALVMGAMAAGASEREVGAMEAYGRHIGLAFQIADDVLDATASAEELGKNPSDTHLDKSTYVVLYGLDEAVGKARTEVDAALGALDSAGVRSEPLEALARYVIERGR